MEARQVIERRRSRSLELPVSGSFPEQVDCGVLIMQIPYGSVAGNARPSQASRPASAPVIPVVLLAAAFLIIFVLLWRVTRLYLCLHRERGC
jgi:hypothetical protein